MINRMKIGGEKINNKKVSQIKADEDIYKTIGDIKLKIKTYKPQDWTINDKNAAIIFFFGGGWVKGTIDHFKKQSEYLASRGIVAITADYRVEDRHGTTPFECVKDGISAVSWVNNHSQELGIDSEKIFVAGGSAGGHVAVSSVIFKDKFKEKQNYNPVGMVLFNPVIDTTEKGYGSQKIGENAKELSPVHHIRQGLPPTIIFHGKSDKVVPFTNAQHFCEKMKKYNNECILIPYQGKGHGFFNYGQDEDNYCYHDTLHRAEKFINSVL
ncbi:MAG: alpha/beta hydrolase [Bacillota bacterium]